MRAAWRTALTTIALMMSVASAHAETPAPAHKVVLLQGNSTERANWDPVIRLLEAANLAVTTVPAPAGSKVALRRTLTSQEGPVVLVASGLGGAITTEFGADPKISALVYVAALAPEGVQDEAREDPARSKKIFYAIAEQGTPIPLALQRFFAARMKAKTIVLDRAETHPREIAGLILEAAGMKPVACGAAEDNGTAACAAPALPRSLAEGCKCTKTPLEDLTSP
jgi:pimeloyl-ACP methyl ester carboxylesterase